MEIVWRSYRGVRFVCQIHNTLRTGF